MRFILQINSINLKKLIIRGNNNNNASDKIKIQTCFD